MSESPWPCGTYEAAQRHYRNREPVDDACAEAVNARSRSYRATPRGKEVMRWHNQVRRAAVRALIARYTAEFAELLDAEKAANPCPRSAIQDEPPGGAR